MVALILPIALCATNCTATKKAAQTAAQQQSFKQTIETQLHPVPMSKAAIKINMADLMKLPNGANYYNRQGQATAQAEIKGDTVYLTALCDSLQREVYRLETSLNETRNSHTITGTEQSSSGGLSAFKRFLNGVLVGFCLFPIIKFIIKKLLKTWL